MYGDVLFPPNVEVVLSGHNHVLEIVDFSSPHPPQFITGNGGDWADEPFPVPFPPGKEPAPGAVVAELAVDDALRLHDDGARRRRLVDARVRLRRQADDVVHARGAQGDVHADRRRAP